MERRLAAVLIADVVGYGRLSQVDEEGTRARFQDDLARSLSRGSPAIAADSSRRWATGCWSSSRASSTPCVARSKSSGRRPSATPTLPLERRLEFRIGINLGDVIVEGDDIHGDGVNIADRMQALAEPGGIAISGTAYDQVKAKLPVGYASLGEQKVKSIAEPVRVYRVLMDPAAAGRTAGGGEPRRRSFRLPAAAAAILLLVAGAALAWWRPWQPAAETATRNPSPPAVGQAVARGAALRQSERGQGAGLSRRRHHRGPDHGAGAHPRPVRDLAQRRLHLQGQGGAAGAVAKELGVRYLLEGSIRRAGDDIRINAQLIERRSSGHLWAERFDGAWSDVFALQDQVVEKVAAALKLRLVAGPRVAQLPALRPFPRPTTSSCGQ